jgi:hypothetical protein
MFGALRPSPQPSPMPEMAWARGACFPLSWTSAAHGHSRDKSDLAKARALIEACSYWRRKEELEDADGI